MRRKSYCVICLKAKRGIPVEDDYVLAGARWFKRNVTRNERNNLLVVCRDCYARYKELRKRYESRQRIYLALGVMFAIVGVLVSPKIGTFVGMSAIVLLLFLFSHLSYVPKIDIKNQHDNK